MLRSLTNEVCCARVRAEKGAPRAFQRVKAEEWLDKKGAWDNSYEATFGNSGWGAGAQAILGQVIELDTQSCGSVSQPYVVAVWNVSVTGRGSGD